MSTCTAEKNKLTQDPFLKGIKFKKHWADIKWLRLETLDFVFDWWYSDQKEEDSYKETFGEFIDYHYGLSRIYKIY